MNETSNKSPKTARSILTIIVGIVVLAAAWQIVAIRQDNSIEDRTQAYLSPLGEFALSIPEGWNLAPESFKKTGSIQSNLKAQRTHFLNSAFEERYGLSISAENSVENDRNIGEFLNSSVGSGYLVASFDALSAAEFTLTESLELWKTEFLKTPTTAEGVSYSELEEIEIGGNPAYRYKSSVIDQGFTVTSVNYFVLAPAIEIEISIFPAESEFIMAAEEVVSNMIIASSKDLVEADPNAGS